MNWSTRIDMSIDYIEDNLTETISIGQAAKIAGSSRYHFHRMFYAMIGVTPADYIRKRRMTLAATELATSDERVIDIALKYGFESPNAFTRAFRKLHGLPPSQARFPKAAFKVFYRASANLKNKGKMMLNYTIIEKSCFKLVGKSQSFEFEQFVKDGPKFWKGYVGSENYKSLWELTQGSQGENSEAPLMSAYFPDEAGGRDVFTDVLGVEFTSDTVVESFDSFSVPSATYAEFNCTYRTSMKTNRYIYGEWFASTGFERDSDKPDIAAYFPVAFRPLSEMRVRWWIPIIKR